MIVIIILVHICLIMENVSTINNNKSILHNLPCELLKCVLDYLFPNITNSNYCTQNIVNNNNISSQYLFEGLLKYGKDWNNCNNIFVNNDIAFLLITSHFLKGQVVEYIKHKCPSLCLIKFDKYQSVHDNNLNVTIRLYDTFKLDIHNIFKIACEKLHYEIIEWYLNNKTSNLLIESSLNIFEKICLNSLIENACKFDRHDILNIIYQWCRKNNAFVSIYNQKNISIIFRYCSYNVLLWFTDKFEIDMIDEYMKYNSNIIYEMSYFSSCKLKFYNVLLWIHKNYPEKFDEFKCNSNMINTCIINTVKAKNRIDILNLFYTILSPLLFKIYIDLNKIFSVAYSDDSVDEYIDLLNWFCNKFNILGTECIFIVLLESLICKRIKVLDWMIKKNQHEFFTEETINAFKDKHKLSPENEKEVVNWLDTHGFSNLVFQI